METTDFVGERFHLDACGETFRTRIDAPANAHGFFGIVPPDSATSEVLLGEVAARELRERLNAYLGTDSEPRAWACPTCGEIFRWRGSGALRPVCVGFSSDAAHEPVYQNDGIRLVPDASQTVPADSAD